MFKQIDGNNALSTSKVFLIISLFIFTSCANQREASPKPHAYPKVDFPDKSFQVYSNSSCTFSFQYPEYARIEQKNSFIDEIIDQPCWFDLVFPSYNGRIHCSYYEIDEDNSLDSLIYDSFALVGKHNVKAQYISETKFALDNKGGGMLFRITGPVASPTQFFVTDSTNHFLRGSLYFYNSVEVDSMRIIYDFVNADIDKMLETFSWE